LNGDSFAALAPVVRRRTRFAAACLTLVAAALLAPGAALANEALARAKNCLACHAVDRKVVGPTYKDIARRYAGQPGSEAALAAKVLRGSKGAWAKELGAEIPMPPNAMVKPDEAATLAKWILGLK
jgi:cytochrome c